MSESSIEQLRIYQLATELEDRVYKLVSGLPKEAYYPLGNNLRRASAAISHYITEAHKRYSYQIKVESLHVARTYADETIKLLEQFKGRGQDIGTLVDDYTTVIKQSWGLIKYLKKRQAETRTEAASVAVQAQDELVSART